MGESNYETKSSENLEYRKFVEEGAREIWERAKGLPQEEIEEIQRKQIIETIEALTNKRHMILDSKAQFH